MAKKSGRAAYTTSDALPVVPRKKPRRYNACDKTGDGDEVVGFEVQQGRPPGSLVGLI